MLADQPPSSSFAWLELFRTNVISLFIRVLSSKDSRMRELALCQVAALWKQMEVSGTSSSVFVDTNFVSF
jgi:nucleolar pre-ribosomal-associated protein 1